MAVELLAIGIRENLKIKGIEINGSILKITQLADDTTCFVADIPSVKEILVMFKCFELCAGLKINTDKTKANYTGSLKGRVEAPLRLDWTETNIHCLCIVLSGNEGDHYELNYKKKRILILRNILNTRKGRKLSHKGKITVINNLALPPLLYVASVIHTPDIVFKEVKTIICDFIWDGKPSTIAYKVVIQSMVNGGLKLMDIETKVESLKSVWVKRFLDLSSHMWKTVRSSFYKTTNIHFFFSANHSPLKFTPKFYQEMQNCWSQARIINNTNIKVDTIQEQVIWNNHYITIAKQLCYWKNWAKNGIVFIKNLLDNDNLFLGYSKINK